MNALMKTTLALAAISFSSLAAAQITFYEREGFEGRSFTAAQRIGNLERFGFNDRASSAVVRAGRWEICDEARIEGNCMVLRPGRYPSLAAMAMNNRITSARPIQASARIGDDRFAPLPTVAPVAAAPRITFYEREGFGGQQFTTEKPVGNFERFGFNDRASSVDVVGNRWEVCEDARFSGRCVVLRPGRYPTLVSLGLNNRVSSVRLLDRNARLDESRYAPAPVAASDGRDYRRRGSERVFEANVTSVRAVVATPEQKCWIEQEQVQQRGNEAVVGALIGGILGYQVGPQTRDVQKCVTVPNQAPSYWDVTYNFRGQDHRVQMSTRPGPTVTVNERGEPRA
jgi:uncharacterized protein YcfJ